MRGAVTVAQLRAALEDYDDDDEVRILHQPHWPLQEVLGGIYNPRGNGGCQFDEGGCEYDEAAPLHQPGEDFDHEFQPPTERVVFLVADGQPRDGSPYGDKDAWDGMRQL